MARHLVERQVDFYPDAMIRAIRDDYLKKQPFIPGQSLAAALEGFQKCMAEQSRAEFERVPRENKSKSDAFLAANKAKTGVVVLPSGVQYRIIETGTGPKPTAASTVQVHLRGSV